MAKTKPPQPERQPEKPQTSKKKTVVSKKDPPTKPKLVLATKPKFNDHPPEKPPPKADTSTKEHHVKSEPTKEEIPQAAEQETSRKRNKNKKRKPKTPKEPIDPTNILSLVLAETDFKHPNLSQSVEHLFKNQFIKILEKVKYETKDEEMPDEDFSIWPHGIIGTVCVPPSAVTSMDCINQRPNPRRPRKWKRKKRRGDKADPADKPESAEKQVTIPNPKSTQSTDGPKPNLEIPMDLI